MIWVIIAIAVLVVGGLVVMRTRSRTAQLEQGREHREVAQRQEQEAAEREEAASREVEDAVDREQEAEAELARAREARGETTAAAATEIDRSERQRLAAEARHSQADEIEERVGPLDEQDDHRSA